MSLRAPSERFAGGDAVAVRRSLRALIREIEQRPPRRPVAGPSVPRELAAAAFDIDSELGTVSRSTALGTCHYRELRYDLDHLFGTEPLRRVLGAGERELALLSLGQDVAGVGSGDLLFLDIETAGLSGAGAYAFLVACARVATSGTQPAVVLRQYFAPSPAAEGALLSALLEDAELDSDPLLVTYNGRAFDAPVLDGRLTMHRLRGSFASLPQLDLLHACRAVYAHLPSRRLAAIEARVLGFTRPSGDVSGEEVPRWYFRFLRTGDPRAIRPLMVHNELDVVALVALLGRLAAMLCGELRSAGSEALGVGRLLARRADHSGAREHLERALRDLDRPQLRDEALARLAAVHKAVGDHHLAEPLWRESASREGGGALASAVELAKLYEHKTKDLERALAFALRALDLAARSRQRDRVVEDLEHRNARIGRKLARRQAG